MPRDPYLPARALVLAAGQGKRLRSEKDDLPKVLRSAAGRPLIGWVLDRLSCIDPQQVMLVMGYQWQRVRAAVPAVHPHVLQLEQRGTGHAVSMAAAWIAQSDSPILVCYGDMPLIRAETYQGLLEAHLGAHAPCTMLSYCTPLELTYGRILRRPDETFDRIVEHRDCNAEQLKIHEYNAGVYVFEPQALLEGLEQLTNANAQKEYYLTDVPGYLRRQGHSIGIYAARGQYECLGVNTQADLDQVSRLLEEEQG